jgi:predicted amidohydrolase YtcJ
MCRSCVSPALSELLTRMLPTRREFLAGCSAFASSLLATGLPSRAAASNIILRNALFVPMTGSARDARALLIADGRIAAIGDEADVMARKTPATQVIDLGGRVVLPGFIDPHMHPLLAAVQSTCFTDCGPDVCKDKPAVIATLKAAAANKKPGEWLYGAGFDNLLQGGDLTLVDVNEASPTIPVFVLYNNSHTASVNAAALKAAEVTKSSADKAGGGHFGRTPSGDLSGVVYETNMMYFLGALRVTPSAVSAGFTQFMRRCAATGMTAMHEAGAGIPGSTFDLFGGYARLAEAGSAPLRLSASPMIEHLDDGNAYARRFGKPGSTAIKVPGTLLSFYAVKIVADGSNQTKTAAQTIPYLGAAATGTLNYSHAELVAKCRQAQALEWPVSIHANGDAALDAALDAIDAVYGRNAPTGVNRIEHCTITRPDQIERMAKLGVQPSFLMNHVYYYGAAYRDQLLGPDRASRMDPASQCEGLVLPFTMHTDAPVTRPGPLQLIQTAVTRRCIVDGSVVGPAQAVSVGEALRAMTIHAAGQIGLGDQIGSLEVGKEADLVVLADDPRSVDPGAIASIGVTETWVAGRRIPRAAL